MADNVPITAGTGTPVATDDIGGVHYQRIKLTDGTADSNAVITGDTANGLDVDVTRVNGVVHVDDNNGSLTVDGTVSVGNFPATQPVSGTVAVSNLPATQPVSGTVTATGPLTDTQLRASAVPVSGSFFQATQPVSLATNTPDVTDRAARLLGHVTVDAAPTTVVTGPLTDAQLRASAVPISDVRLPATLKTLPAGADGLPALPVYITSILLLSYDAAARNLSTGALVANTAKAVLSIEHGAASTKTVKIRRIMVGGLQTAAVAGMVDIQITKGTAASSAGTAVIPNTRKGGDTAPEAVVKSLPTIVAGTVGDIMPWGATAATANTPMPTMVVYDWQEGGETKPLQLRAGVLESIVVNVISTAAQNLTLTVSVDFTEE